MNKLEKNVIIEMSPDTGAPYYPSVQKKSVDSFIELRTTIRLEKDSEWYDCVCRVRIREDSDDFVMYLNLWHKEIYESIHLMRPLPISTEFYPKSPMQMSEKERLKIIREL